MSSIGRGSSFEWTWISFIQGALLQVRLKLDHRFWRMSLNVFKYRILLFRYYLPLERGLVLQLNKLEFPLHKNTLCQVFFKPGSLLIEMKVFTFRQCIFTTPLWSPIGKWRVALFVQTWVLFIQQYFLPSLVEIGTVVCSAEKDF